jgi:hypothetical protein
MLLVATPRVFATCDVGPDVRMPPGAPNYDVTHVLAIAPDGRKAWAVGVSEFPSPHGGSVMQLWRFDGRWRSAGRHHLGSGWLADVSGSGRNVWLVGTREHSYPTGAFDSLVQRWDGVRWREVPDDAANWGATHVLVLGRDDVWVSALRGSGRSVLEHWDGASWTVSQLPGSPAFHTNDMAGSSPDDVWVAGVYGARRRASPGFLHWDGVAWRTAEPPPGPAAGQVWVVRVAATYGGLWAFGAWGRSSYSRRVVAFWDGSTWTAIPPPGRYVSDAIVGPRTGSLVVLLRGDIERWDGSEWRYLVSTGLPYWATLAADRSGRVWVAGGRSNADLYGRFPVAARYCVGA